MTRVLLTRSRDQSEAVAAELAKDGLDALIWPLLTIRTLLTAPLRPASGEELIFTSARAIEASPDPLPDVRAWCVGPATTAAARARGLTAEETGGDAEALVSRLAPTGRAFLHVRGADARGEVAARLSKAGSPTSELVAYKAVAATAAPMEVDSAIRSGGVQIVSIFSPRTASIFGRLASPRWNFKAMTLVAISEAAAEPICKLGFTDVIIAERPDGLAMRAAICGAARR